MKTQSQYFLTRVSASDSAADIEYALIVIQPENIAGLRQRCEEVANLKIAPQSVVYGLPVTISVMWLNLDISDVFRSENLINTVNDGGGAKLTFYQQATLMRYIDREGNTYEWKTDVNTETLHITPEGEWYIGSLFKYVSGSLRTYRLPVKLWGGS